jgi:hypothetical protein
VTSEWEPEGGGEWLQRFDCEPPPLGVVFQVLEDEWDLGADPPRRTIRKVRVLPRVPTSQDMSGPTNEISDRRPDGWPLCPVCGEDELWSPLSWDGTGEKPPIAAYEAAGLTCYRCNWKSRP